MEVEMTQRANIAFQKADGNLKRRLLEIMDNFRAQDPMSHEQMRKSNSRGGVWIMKVNDYRLFFEKERDVVRIIDIIPRSEAYQ